MSIGNLVSMSVDIFGHVTVHMFMFKHVYVYEYDCFMYVHMCTYCICTHFMTMYSERCTDTVSVVLRYIN